MRFAFTIWFRFFCYIVYIWRRFPPINLGYMSLWSTSRLVLTFTSFMYENQPELIDTYFSHEYCFHFENKGQCLLIAYVFQSFYEKLYVYISIYNGISRLQSIQRKLSNTPKQKRLFPCSHHFKFPGVIQQVQIFVSRKFKQNYDSKFNMIMFKRSIHINYNQPTYMYKK